MAVSLNLRSSPYYYGGGGSAPRLPAPRPQRIQLQSTPTPRVPGIGADATPPQNYYPNSTFNPWTTPFMQQYGGSSTGFGTGPPGVPPPGAGGGSYTYPVMGPNGATSYNPSTGWAGAAGTPPALGSPDWQSLIGGSYEVAGAQALMASQMARARANLQAQIRQGFIDLGAPAGTDLGGLGSYIDKDTMQAAINNKYSTYSQIGQQERRSNATNNAQLAARGILSSGQTTKSLQDVTNAAEQNRYGALRQFLAAGQQGLMGLGDLEAQQAQALMQAQFAAAQRLAQQYPYYGSAGTPGSPYLGGGPYAGTPTSDVYYDPAQQYVPVGALPQGSPTGIPDWSWFSQWGL